MPRLALGMRMIPIALAVSGIVGCQDSLAPRAVPTAPPPVAIAAPQAVSGAYDFLAKNHPEVPLGDFDVEATRQDGRWLVKFLPVRADRFRYSAPIRVIAGDQGSVNLDEK